MRYLQKFKTFIMIGLITGMTFSCQIEEVAPSPENVYVEKSADRMIKLGRKLDNPFSLENMEKAAENLAYSNKGKKINITPTHLYVKFKPKSREEMESLHASDTALILFNYPLDYEIVENGSYYHDPEVPVDQPTYQYTSVPIDYTFPANVAYEILEEVHIPEHSNSTGRSSDDAMALEHEAYRITGNLTEEAVNSKSTQGRAASWFTWRPSGRLRVWDDIIGSNTTTSSVFSHYEYYECDDLNSIERSETTTSRIEPPPEAELCRRAVYTHTTTTTQGSFIPLEGIKVRAHTFTKIAWGTTNVNGNYSVNVTFAKWKPVQYSLIWETGKHVIFDATDHPEYTIGVPALHNGPLKDGSWNWDIRGGKHHGYATIHRASYRYHSKNIGGLKRPGVVGRQVISYVDGNGSGLNIAHYWQQIVSGAPFPHIIVWSKTGNGTKKLSNLVFATTIHEIGHSSHIELMRQNYAYVDEVIYESWAEAVEWYITAIDYAEKGVGNYDKTDIGADRFKINGQTYHLREHRQWWLAAHGIEYTPVFIDMVDNYNQFARRGSNFPDDAIVNYTMGGIEGGFLENVYNMNGLRTQLQNNRPGGVTTTQINTYMNYYN